jgi:hypothetical protein
MYKTRYHLHIFSKKMKLIHRCFNSSLSNCSIWINHVEFSLFFGSVRFTSAQLALPSPFFLLGAVSPPANVVTLSHRVMLSSHGVKTSSLTLLHLLTLLQPVTFPLEVKLKHWICTTATSHPFLDSLTLIIHCYKKVILTFVTLPTTQSHLYFASSLARALRHRSFTHRHCSFSPPSHVHRPSTQRHPWR